MTDATTPIPVGENHSAQSLQVNLREMERTREAYWLRYPQTSPIKLRWRALTVRHCFHVLPGESILELGAGSGLWTDHLATVLGGDNPITAAVFNDDLAAQAEQRNIPNTTVARVRELAADLPEESFDYVVGTAILSHDEYSRNLSAIRSLLKPGGQILFFEANFWNPQVLLKNLVPPLGRWAGNARCQIGMRKYRLLQQTSRQGFIEVEIIPYDIVHPLTPRRLIRVVQSTAYVLEHVPGMRELCGTLYIWAKKPGDEDRRRLRTDLTAHPNLFASVSVVVPCHNEQMNIRPLVKALLETYDAYIHEIIIVNDNSTDATADIVRALMLDEPRVKLVDRRPPAGVGRALKDGYAFATGKYILSMDCDFLLLVPELRDLFAVVAAGKDGAMGSRFSHESILINYPFFKIVANRSFHLFVRVFLGRRVRDISNNLKLYRAEIFKNLEIEEPGFAANAETGLKPLLAGYDIEEVPVSWINRSADMGSSSFGLVKVAPGYWLTLLRLLWRGRGRSTPGRASTDAERG